MKQILKVLLLLEDEKETFSKTFFPSWHSKLYWTRISS